MITAWVFKWQWIIVPDSMADRLLQGLGGGLDSAPPERIYRDPYYDVYDLGRARTPADALR